jgi:hypothetical protein
MGYNKTKIVLGLAGAASSSTGTSNPSLVGDCRLLTLSIQTSTASASRFTVSLSNWNGMQEAIPETSWSVATTILSAGVFTIDPGANFVRVERPAFGISATSNVTMILNRHYQ